MASVRRVNPAGMLAVAVCAFVCVNTAVAEKIREAQSAPPSQPVAPAAAISYPDNVGGLKQLAGDILNAQQKNDGVRAGQLLDSLVLPNFSEWYSANFAEPAVARVVPAYAANASGIQAQLAQIFLSAYSEGFRGVAAVRYEDAKSACSSPPVFTAMAFLRTHLPLYELRFTHGDQFKRVFAFAYVDGAFRLVLVPDFSRPNSQAPQRPAGSDSSKVPLERIRMGGPVTAAQLVCKVQPYYPEEARMQHISGTVKFHTIIAKDGGVRQLEVLSGPDILVQAAKAAVSRWRYRPTMLNGEPVEVDTTIDVIFSLQ